MEKDRIFVIYLYPPAASYLSAGYLRAQVPRPPPCLLQGGFGEVGSFLFGLSGAVGLDVVGCGGGPREVNGLESGWVAPGVRRGKRTGHCVAIAIVSQMRLFFPGSQVTVQVPR